jgi:AraC-like DNA-binding protein
MSDWDIACADQAQAMSVKCIPHTTVCILIQYRAPMPLTWSFGSHDFRYQSRRHFATKLRAGLTVMQPRAPVGAICVRLRPEAAAQFLGEPIRYFLDAQISLDDLFGAGQVGLLEEMLAEARTSAERFAYLETFLLANLRPRQAEPVACRAAALLRESPHASVRHVAARLDVSERHLRRNFSEMFGMAPKQFARIARIERVLAARASESSWADIADSVGFSDQAHMINDFTEIVGVSPGQLVPVDSGE